jgi:integrase/recombinase XerD
VRVLRENRSGATSDDHLVRLWLANRPESTQGVYAPVAVAFLQALPSGLVQATAADVIQWAETLQGEPATVARKVSTVKSLLSFAYRTGYVPFNVGRILQCRHAPNTLNERIVEEPTIAGLIDRASEGRDRTLVRFLYLSGCRLSEALHVRFCDIAPGGRVTVTGKGDRTRAILVPENIAADLQALRRPTDDDRAFVFKSYRGRRLDERDGRRVVSRAARKLDLKLSPHWLRHAHASHALDHGAPIHLVQRDLGHASVATTSKYLHARPQDGSSRFLPSV